MSGRGRLDGVELADLRTGAVRFVGCDTLVFTGDWIPDHELARLAGAEIDPGTRGPAVDTALETSVPNVFAAGNLVHAAETADVAALGGRHAARHLAAALRPGPPRGLFLLRSEAFQRLARLEVRQGDRVLATARARLVPERPVHLDAGWIARADPSAGPVRVTLR